MTDSIVRCNICFQNEFYDNRAIHLFERHDIAVMDAGMTHEPEIYLRSYESPDLDRYFTGVLK